ncbi:uncharacterized protein TNIN_278941 [Trichonephila inaurata madagascariensis]|uniref:Uncharacterized protein n=1 Tax=Trichonephila inaurata madagascariensis TaxID=2747483 RepID=A0A8X6Y4N6_9ARAC|nr:uncharacterized protein TNIN_278941 [Trichonephila inaurata madagascariensis]
MAEYMHYTIYLQYPCLFVVSISNLVYRYGLILVQFNSDVINMDFVAIPTKCREIVEVYNGIEKKVRLLKDSLSTSLFIMLANSFFNFYTCLSTAFLRTNPPHYVLEAVCNAFTGIFTITTLTIFLSRIPETMMTIKTTLGSLIEEYQCCLNGGKEIYLLERMEKKDIIYLSACNIIDFKKTFLLSAFGTVFTYGLIIVNIK